MIGVINILYRARRNNIYKRAEIHKKIRKKYRNLLSTEASFSRINFDFDRKE